MSLLSPPAGHGRTARALQFHYGLTQQYHQQVSSQASAIIAADLEKLSDVLERGMR